MYPKLHFSFLDYPRILVIGNSEAAVVLQQRIAAEIDGSQTLVLSREPLDEPFDLVMDVDRPERLSLSDYDYGLYQQLPWSYCLGLTPARKALRDTDWQAQRDLERIFLQWHDDGKNTLPTATLNLLRHREIMRAETDVEPDHRVI